MTFPAGPFGLTSVGGAKEPFDFIPRFTYHSCVGIQKWGTAQLMDAQTKQRFIRTKAAQRKVKWSRHALNELASEPMSVGDMETALPSAEVIEDYPHLHQYLPDCLVLAFVAPDEPIHCVVAINEPHDYILIMTVYRPTAQEWEDDWRTRK